MTDIYHEEILDTNINIYPRDLNGEIDEILELNLRNKVEGICIKEGYVQPGSVNILSRSNGMMNVANFDGLIMYSIKYKVNICNPREGDIIECTVSDNNKSSVNAYYSDEETSPLNIFIAKQFHIGDTDFIKLKKGDNIKVKVVRVDYSYLDKEVFVLGKFIDKI
jgi:DNA-directed RNA polymerase subunit E'/Rpb7